MHDHACIGSGKLKSKTWYHLAGTFDGKTLKFYKNGKLAGEKDSKIGAGVKDTFIGAHPNPTIYFQGIIIRSNYYYNIIIK